MTIKNTRIRTQRGDTLDVSMRPDGSVSLWVAEAGSLQTEAVVLEPQDIESLLEALKVDL